MAPVMRNKSNHNSSEVTPATDDQSWEQLYDRIRVLTLKRSAAMLAETIDEDDAFDRGARSLRMLMSAAEISRRMKLQDAKEKSLDDKQEIKPVVSDARISDVFRDVEQSVDRVEKSSDKTKGNDGSVEEIPSGASGKAVEDQRS